MIKVVRGNPTPEELAAAVTVLLATRTAATVPAHEPASFWASRRHLLGTPHAHGPVGWLAPALPQ
ncbi:acyl-CoA carboxylase subunit epsilon [Streptomyces sp. NPDC020792]|uniref:acyl-CoA carboxylase subunit epsilon n=1 Tax=Streptomyces sp. NPDC020792 TaxID=3365089 RepID=UPI0037AF5312